MKNQLVLMITTVLLLLLSTTVIISGPIAVSAIQRSLPPEEHVLVPQLELTQNPIEPKQGIIVFWHIIDTFTHKPVNDVSLNVSISDPQGRVIFNHTNVLAVNGVLGIPVPARDTAIIGYYDMKLDIAKTGFRSGHAEGNFEVKSTSRPTPDIGLKDVT